MSKNFGKYFLSGFQPNFARGYDTSYRYEKLNAERDETREYERKLKEEDDKRKAAEQEKSMQMVNRLLNGGLSTKNTGSTKGSPPPNYLIKDSEETRKRLASGMSAADVNKWQDIQQQFAPEKDEWTNLDLNDPKAIYGFNKTKQTYGKMQDGNPGYKPKMVDKVEGYDADGKGFVEFIYEDKTTQKVPTSKLRKFNSEGKQVEQFDVNSFNKTLNKFTDEDIRLNRLKEYPNDADKYEINSSNQNNAAQLYGLMDEDGRTIINQFFDQLKGETGKRGVDYTQFERQKQNELKKKFQIAVGNAYKNSDGSPEAYARNRALILYSNFKYGYIE